MFYCVVWSAVFLLMYVLLCCFVCCPLVNVCSIFAVLFDVFLLMYVLYLLLCLLSSCLFILIYFIYSFVYVCCNFVHLGDNCIVFENFTASIGDLMVANWVYWRRVSGANKRIFATIKSTIDAVKFSNTIHLSPF